MALRQVGLTDFLTEEEIARAIELYQICAAGSFARAVDAQIITPNIDRINAALGQENDPRYLAYAVDYILSKQFEPHR
jgi:hypothetical protein